MTALSVPVSGPARLGALVLLLAACAEAPERQSARALPGERAIPDVLVESRALDHRPTSTGNRLLRGWRFQEPGGELLVTASDGEARLEIVNLVRRPRILRLGFDIPPSSTRPLPVNVGFPGGESLELQAAADLEIPLPGDLPTGRVSIDLRWPPQLALDLRRSGLGGSMPAGDVRFTDGEIRQSGWSRVDVVEKAGGAGVVKVRFEPPAEATGEHSFELHVAGDVTGERVAFSWRPSLLGRLRGGRELEIPLDAADTFTAIRLVARGEGPAARWLGLRLEAPTEDPPVTTVPAPPPIVVLYVLDALRADVLGHLGSPDGASPTLDRLAAEGVTLTRHHAVAPNTTPSTKSLFTGQYYPWLGQKKLPAEGPETLAELFRDAGYRTGAFSGNGNISRPAGNTRGFEVLARYATGSPRQDSSYNDDAEKVHAAALEWLDGLSPEDKVFLYLHTVHPHGPYDPPEPFLSRFTQSRDPQQIDGDKDTLRRLDHEGTGALDAADRERLRRLYLAGLAYNDAHLADLLANLEARYPDRETLLIVTSDHGEELFEHGGVLHGSTLYQEQLHVPLIVHWPSRLGPARVDALTDSLDLHQTLRQMLGAPPARGLGASRSLWPLLLGDGTSHKDIVFASRPSRGEFAFSARSERYKLIWAPRDGTGPGMGSPGARSHDLEYVFDLEKDPAEKHNLAGQPSLEVEWLRGRLRSWLQRGAEIETGEEITGLDEETRAILRALGYLDG